MREGEERERGKTELERDEKDGVSARGRVELGMCGGRVGIELAGGA